MGSFSITNIYFGKHCMRVNIFSEYKKCFWKLNASQCDKGQLFPQGTEHTIEEFPENSVMNDN